MSSHFLLKRWRAFPSFEKSLNFNSRQRGRSHDAARVRATVGRVRASGRVPNPHHARGTTDDGGSPPQRQGFPGKSDEVVSPTPSRRWVTVVCLYLLFPV